MYPDILLVPTDFFIHHRIVDITYTFIYPKLLTNISITTLGDSFRLHPGTPKGDTIQGIPSARGKRKYRVLFAEFFNPRNLYMLLGQTRAKYGADVEIVAVVPSVAPEMVRASDGDAIYGGVRSLRERIQEKVDRCLPPNPSLTIIGIHAHPFQNTPTQNTFLSIHCP